MSIELIRGCVSHNLGTTAVNKTGNWRVFKPVVNNDKCKPCVICSRFCPDGVIKCEKGNDIEINYFYCKGCGICAHECPRDAIEMQREEI
ncbi:MAG: 4Fe-4S binding protein [Spirochaetota bacterium]|nr:4Fe-4S binding protein [Spirochaetota bacterium]